MGYGRFVQFGLGFGIPCLLININQLAGLAY